MVRIQEHVPSLKKSSLNFHQEKMLLLSCLFYFCLQVGTQYVFLFLLMYQYLSLVSQAIIHCVTDSYPGSYLRLTVTVRVWVGWGCGGTMEKHMPIYTLITLSFTVMLFCLSFFMHRIHHYLLKGLSNAKFWLHWHLEILTENLSFFKQGSSHSSKYCVWGRASSC